MKLETPLTHAASRNCIFTGSLAGRHHRAFTLIELIVAMAIIALLMGIFFRHPPDPPICENNLRNLYLALLMYTDDNDGRCPDPNVTGQIPISQKYMEELLTYVKSEEIFWCPKDKEKSKHPGGSYGWRVTRDPKTSIAGKRLGLLRYPSKVIIAGELSHGWHKSETINVLYADGHVGQVTMKEFLKNITTPLEFK